MSFNVNQNFESAVTLHEAGRLSEAEGIYRNILAVDPKHVSSLHLLGVIALQVGRHDVAVDLIGQAITANKRNADFHNNIGVALRALGRLDEAIDHFRRALKLKPDHADAHNNLGLGLKDQGQLEEAEGRYRRALSIWPDHAEARNNLGLALMWQGRLAEAVALYRQALALNPHYGEAYTNLAMALVTAQEFAAALAALRCALAVKDTHDARSLVVHCLKNLKSTQDVADLRDFVWRALSEGWDRPVELSRVSAAPIKRNPMVGECVERAIKAGRLPAEELFASSGFATVYGDQLLQCLLQSTPICDLELERFLTAARFALLRRAAADTGASNIEEGAVGFYCALARQCFINEYVFACGEDEMREALELRERLAAALEAGATIPILWPAAVAAYFPLNSLPCSERLLDRSSSDSRSDAVIGVLVQQLCEPREEQQIRPDIPRLTGIEDPVSRMVQQQYE